MVSSPSITHRIAERRHVSWGTLLDGAVRAVRHIEASPDPAARTHALRALALLEQMRDEIPARRRTDPLIFHAEPPVSQDDTAPGRGVLAK